MSRFAVTSDVRDGVATVRLEGELDLSSAPSADHHLLGVETPAVRQMVLDLTSLDFLDSTGLRVVLAADARARRDGRRLVVVPGPEPVHRVFRIALLDRRLEFAVHPEDGRDA